MDLRASIAAVRFGLGPRAGDGAPADAAAWLEGQIARPAPQQALPGLAPPLARGQAAAMLAAVLGGGNADRQAARALAQATQADVVAWTGHCLLSAAPFQDRLTNFWANHFTVSRRVRNAGVFIGPLIRDAIRPNLFGRFEDMLLAVERHPAMLIYLANVRSIGPNSVAGHRAASLGNQRGLNENLAREILELHTLAPAGGYSQADVTAFAAAITGWGIEREGEAAGSFRFRPALHEPGEKLLLGRRLPEGEAGGVEALRMLARHPATARHLATKLARHFVADDPPRAAVARLEAVFLETQGDLGAVSRALARLPEAWSPPLSKLRAPMDYVLAVGRVLGLGPEAAPALTQAATSFGQAPWAAPQPNGWPDTAEEWAQPEALMHRIEWAHAVAGRAAGFVRDPRGFAGAALGPLGSAETLREAGRAGSPQDAITLILVSPEFQRR